jgi:heparan-sulfate lyase
MTKTLSIKEAGQGNREILHRRLNPLPPQAVQDDKGHRPEGKRDRAEQEIPPSGRDDKAVAESGSGTGRNINLFFARDLFPRSRFQVFSCPLSSRIRRQEDEGSHFLHYVEFIVEMMNNTSILKALQFIKCIFLLPVFIAFCGHYAFSQPADPSGEMAKLLSRINLETPELRKVSKVSGNTEKAAARLLKYYRHRTSVKHPIGRKERLKSAGNYASARDLEIADNALKHIFIGQTAYPPNFRGDNIDWATNPVRDNEWIWQLHRMYFWESMAKAYWHTGDEKYAREWSAQLIDWTRKNPNDPDHRYAWRSIETGIRGHSWTGLYQRFIDSPSFTPEVLVAFLNSLCDHAEFLMTQYRTKSNWGLMEAEGLAFIAITFPEFSNALKWRTEAIRRLNNEIDLQVYPDGHQRELAIGYHLGCINWFMNTWELTELNGIQDAFPPSYMEKIMKMCEVPLKITHPDGTNAQFGDAWSGRPGQHASRYLEWSKLFQRDDFLFLATNGREGLQPEATAFALKESGIYSLRSGWNKEAICLVLKCGPDGGGHCQPDNGTFELSAGGRTLMPDAGSYIYSGDPENRAWFRQTKVHQTLTLDGKNSKYAPKLLLWQPGDSLDILVVENQSYDNLAHRRSFFFVDKKYFVIVDEAIGSASGEIGLHFQLAPGKAVMDKTNLFCRSDFDSGWNVLVKSQPQAGVSMVEEEGQVSFLYTKKEPRPAFGFLTKKDEGQSHTFYVTLVIPYEKEVPSIHINHSSIIPGTVDMEISQDGVIRELGYRLN